MENYKNISKNLNFYIPNLQIPAESKPVIDKTPEFLLRFSQKKMT